MAWTRTVLITFAAVAAVGTLVASRDIADPNDAEDNFQDSALDDIQLDSEDGAERNFSREGAFAQERSRRYKVHRSNYVWVSQCRDLGGISGSLGTCMARCDGWSGCTAFNFANYNHCIMRACSVPAPEPNHYRIGWKGYSLDTAEPTTPKPTTPTPAPTPPPSTAKPGPHSIACKDSSSKCSKWEKAGKCSKRSVFDKCKSSCHCGEGSHPACEDYKKKKCARMAAKGRCSEMRVYTKCKDSCYCDNNGPTTAAPPPTNGGDVKFTFINRCSQDLWMGADGRSESRPTFIFNGLKFHVPKKGGWYLPKGETSHVYVPHDFFGARFWARTGCTGTPHVDFKCETGDCGPWIECAHDNKPRGGNPPATLAEFTLNSQNKDWYDISHVDGFNLPMTIAVENPGATEPNSNEFWCTDPICKFNINSVCPSELSVKGSSGETVACHSGCSKFNNDMYCCRGAYGLPTTCKPENWPVNWPDDIYMAHCPQAYSYAYDDESSTFTCRNTNYKIYFC